MFVVACAETFYQFSFLDDGNLVQVNVQLADFVSELNNDVISTSSSFPPLSPSSSSFSLIGTHSFKLFSASPDVMLDELGEVVDEVFNVANDQSDGCGIGSFIASSLTLHDLFSAIAILSANVVKIHVSEVDDNLKSFGLSASLIILRMLPSTMPNLSKLTCVC